VSEGGKIIFLLGTEDEVLKVNGTKWLKKKKKDGKGGMKYQRVEKKMGGNCVKVKKISGWKRRSNSQAIQQISSMEEFVYPNVYYRVHNASNRIITRSLLLSFNFFLISKKGIQLNAEFFFHFGHLFCFNVFRDNGLSIE